MWSYHQTHKQVYFPPKSTAVRIYRVNVTRKKSSSRVGMREIMGAYILEGFWGTRHREIQSYFNAVHLLCQTLYVICTTIHIYIFVFFFCFFTFTLYKKNTLTSISYLLVFGWRKSTQMAKSHMFFCQILFCWNVKLWVNY